MSKSFPRLPDCLWQPLVKWQSPSGALRPQQSFRPFHFQPPTSQLETSLSLSATHITTCSFTFTFSHPPHNLQLHFHIQQPTSNPAASFSHSATYPSTCNLTFTFTLSHLPHNLLLTFTFSHPPHNLQLHFNFLRPHNWKPDHMR